MAFQSTGSREAKEKRERSGPGNGGFYRQKKGILSYVALTTSTRRSHRSGEVEGKPSSKNRAGSLKGLRREKVEVWSVK